MEGIFGISSRRNCLKDLYDGTFCLQHRGQEYCGLSTFDGEEVKIRTHRGLVGQTFKNDLLGLDGYLGIGYTGSDTRQPVSRYSKNGEYMVAFDGFLTNAGGLREESFSNGYSFATEEDSELIAALIAQGGTTIAEGIEKMLKRIKGPCSLVLLSKDGVYAARDLLGRRPLVLGRGKNSWAVASETVAFDAFNVGGIKRVRDLEPGEIVFLAKEKEPESIRLGNGRSQFCSFGWIYYDSPNAVTEGISVAVVRHKLGQFLAQKDRTEADVVGPVPFSGILHAEGYHLESRIPMVAVFLLPQYIKRTYIMPLSDRKKEKDKKLRPLHENVRGKRIKLVDDSIRSGITIRRLVRDLKRAGAKRVEVLIASPPSVKYCPYVRFPLKEEDFIASRMTVDEIKEFIGADALIFQDLEKVPEAIGLPADSLCLECFIK